MGWMGMGVWFGMMEKCEMIDWDGDYWDGICYSGMVLFVVVWGVGD